MCGFTLKIFYLILYSGDSQTIVGGEIYYFLCLAIFGFSFFTFQNSYSDL